MTLTHANIHDGEVRYLREGTGTPVVLLHTLRTQLEYFRPLIDHLDTKRVETRSSSASRLAARSRSDWRRAPTRGSRKSSP
jgi:hypothetical protein